MVIAIIAMLAAMLLPVLSRCKANATGAQCVSNQRQLLLAFKLYTDDHNGNLPPYFNVPIEMGNVTRVLDLNGGGIWPHEAPGALSFH